MQLIREPMLSGTSTGVKLLSLLLIIVVSLLFTLIFGLVGGYIIYGPDLIDYVMNVSSPGNPELVPMLKYLQMINTLGLFIIPPLLFAFMVSKNPWHYLAMHHAPARVASILGVAVVIVILPFLHWTANLNEMMDLPEGMAGIERWMENSEVQAREITELFLSTTTYGGLLINLLMIAVLTAIGEEFLFRGVLLRLFREWTHNSHIAVILSALLFSALHLQFYGFLPRFILGVFLGYLFVWTRSIWVPVIVHFFNNGIIVTVAWLYERDKTGVSAESLGDSTEPVMIISSLLMVTALTFMIFYYESKKKGSTIE